GDKKEHVEKTIQEALERSSIIITTGGLGPTIDDITRKIVAHLFQRNLKLNDTIYQKLTTRFGEHSSLQDQATVVEGAILFENTLGTAPGFILQNETLFPKSTLICLPGVPLEMKEML